MADNDPTTEHWKPLPVAGFGDLFEISDLGRIRRGNRLLRPYVGPAGYASACLCRRPLPQRNIRVARCVALAFLPSPGSGQDQVNHLNGVKTDDRASNLEWATGSENQLHATRVLGKRRGMANGLSKLTDAQVGEIRTMWAATGRDQRGIARRFGVSQRLVNLIIHRKIWTHLL